MVPPIADRVMFDLAIPPAESVTDAGLNVTVGPGCETDPVSVRVPLNPLRLVRVIVTVEVDPCVMLKVERLVLMLKSGIVTVMLIDVVFVVEPLMPFIVAA